MFSGNARRVSLLAVLAVTLSLVVVMPGASSAATGTASDVSAMTGGGAAAPAPRWPDGDFTASLPVGARSARDAAAPPAPTLAAPADGVTVASTRPRLSVEPATGLAYKFVVGTGEAPDAGQVATSGWVDTPEWTVPAGVLTDGTPYSWTAQVRDEAAQESPLAPARQLVVNLRLGQQDPSGPIPMDSVGPVSMNLATGNVTTSMMTSYQLTGAGPQYVRFTYNSLLADQSGLVGSYFAGDSAEGIGADERPATVRTDSEISFLWGRNAPGGIDQDRFRVRWEGKLRVPATGTYTFGGLYRAGLRVRVDDRQVFDRWTGKTPDTAAYGEGIRLEAGRSYSIQVDYRSAGAPSFVQLWARVDSGRAAPVPAAWLSPLESILPPGWTMSPDPRAFVTATATETGLRLTDGSGASTTFTRRPAGGFGAAGGSGELTRAENGTITATSAAGVTSVFGADGTLKSVRGSAQDPGAAATSPGRDGQQRPAALSSAPARIEATPAGAGSPLSRPTSMSTMDRAAGVQFHYAGSDRCADDTAPAGYLCAVEIPDGSISYLSYQDGQLAKLVNPGDEITAMAFDRANRLTKIRPPMVMDWIGVDAGARDSDAATYLLDYDRDSGRVSRVATPEPTGLPQRGSERTVHAYRYGADNTEVSVAGLDTRHGWARRVTRDIGGRMLTDTDATGLTTRYQWAPTDQRLSKIDPAGRRTTMVAGPDGMTTYGPAPQNCFTEDGRPVDPAPAGCARLPIEKMSMDGAGLTTTTVESDGLADRSVAMGMNDVGLPVSNTVDPGGLALETRTDYDEMFRRKALTLPTGAAISYEYYGPEETAVDPCDPADPLPQLGLLKTNRTPAPANGEPRVDNYVYDTKGLEAGMNFGTDKWVCGDHDPRGRTSTILIQGDGLHPDRFIQVDFAPDGNPLAVRQQDEYGTLTGVMDLLGRSVAYTDLHGVHTTSEFDRAGRLVSQTTTPPDPADPAVTTTRRYDAAGRLLEVRYGDKTMSTSRFDAAGELVSVRYANGTELAAIDRDGAGRVTGLNWRLADGKQVASSVTRTRAGTVIDESLGGVDARPDGPNYSYDAAGRLVQAWVNGHHYTYDFTSPSAAECPAGTKPDAGRNGNAVRIIDETAAGTESTYYCYDNADRLLAAGGANTVTDVKYSSAAHMAEYTLNEQRVKITYDVAERYTSVSIDGDDPAKVTYGYDAFDSVTSRTVEGSKDDDGKVLYHANLSGATEALELRADKRVLNRTIPLPGGVIATPPGEVTDAGQTWRHPNVHGDIAMVVDDAGRQSGDLFSYTPYGAPLTPDGRVDPDHVPSGQAGAEYAWFGQHYKRYEHSGGLSFVVQGLRPLDTLMGRYHSVSTVDNSLAIVQYQYPKNDPVNTMNLNGWMPLPNYSDLTGNTVSSIGGSADPPR